jgi:hypothetical protein
MQILMRSLQEIPWEAIPFNGVPHNVRVDRAARFHSSLITHLASLHFAPAARVQRFVMSGRRWTVSRRYRIVFEWLKTRLRLRQSFRRHSSEPVHTREMITCPEDFPDFRA